MKFLRYACVFLLLILLGGTAIPVQAQNYAFQVTDEAVVVSINTDGSINIDYTMTLSMTQARTSSIMSTWSSNYNYNLKSIAAEIQRGGRYKNQ